jgi:chorismate synthase
LAAGRSSRFPLRIRGILRPGHADYTASAKFGGFNDYRGSGRFSGRITASFVMAGAVAKKLLSTIGIDVIAHTVEIGGIRARQTFYENIRQQIGSSSVNCADSDVSGQMQDAIVRAAKSGDSLGGIVEAVALNVPPGLGEPVFDTLEGSLAKAFFAVPAVKGVEFGAGFGSARMTGSQNNDPFLIKAGTITTATNNAGGILGGVSTGMPIVARVAVKPTPSISKTQESIDLRTQTSTELKIRGRHDTCIVPRAVPVIESMMAITLVDFALEAQLMPRVLK